MVDPSGYSVLAAILIGALIGAIIGGAVTYNTASETGLAGWELAETTLLGALAGGLIGGGLGYIAPSIGAFLSTSFTFGLPSLSAGGAMAMAVSLTGAQIAGIGAALVGAGALFFSNKTNTYQRKNAAPRIRSNSRKSARDKVFHKGGKKPPILHWNGPHGPHFHPADPRFQHWHYYFSWLPFFAWSNDDES